MLTFLPLIQVNQSELPYRHLVRRYGAQLCYTPMIHAASWVKSAKFRQSIFSTDSSDRPLIAQFCANDPDTFVEAVRILETMRDADGNCIVDAVDLNLGCPQGIAKRGKYGAYLLHEPELVGRLVNAVATRCNLPITCKIRIVPGDIEKTYEFVDMLQANGCCLITIHGRTRDMIKTKITRVNLDVIAEVKRRAQVPVFANGGVESMDDVQRILEYTGVDGVMSSEAILENPFLFSPDVATPSPDFTVESGIRAALEYLECYHRCAATAAENARLASESPQIYRYIDSDDGVVRPHLFKFLYRALQLFPQRRQELAVAEVSELDAIVRALQSDIERFKQESPDEFLSQLNQQPSWYRRHLTDAGFIAHQKSLHGHVQFGLDSPANVLSSSSVCTSESTSVELQNDEPIGLGACGDDCF